MESDIKKSVLKFDPSDDNVSLIKFLEETFENPESHSQESYDSDDDYILLHATRAKEKIGENLKAHTELSMEELINDIKAEVEQEINVGFRKREKIKPTAEKQIKIERKRKPVSELNGYLKTNELKRHKGDIQDKHLTPSTKHKQTIGAQPIIYTTRLDEMNIFRKKLKNFDRLFIWDEILRESKPIYNYQKAHLKQPTHNKKHLTKLYNRIKMINNKETLKVLEKKVHEEKKVKKEFVKEEEITFAGAKFYTQSNKNECKIIDNIDLSETEANDNQIIVPEIKNEMCTPTFNIDDEVIDLTNAFICKNYDNNTSLIDKILSEHFQDLSEKVTHKSDVLSESLETTPVNVLKNNNRLESVKKVDRVRKSATSRKTSKSNGPKKTKRKRKTSADAAILAQEALTKIMFSSVVYTTRLNDMLVLRNSVKFLDGKYVLNEILRESKPSINLSRIQETNASSEDKISFERLKVKLKIINRKNKLKGSVDTDRDANTNLIPSEFICKVRNKTDDARLLLNPNNPDNNFFIFNPYTKILEEVVVYQNIALIIYNKVSKRTEMLVTNNKGNVVEFRNWTMNSFKNTDYFWKEIDPSKQIIKISTCCWFHVKMNIEKIWSSTDTGIGRFIQSIHKCLPGNCKCCCKPKLGLSLFKLKIDPIELEDNNTVLTRKDKVNSLIGRALLYHKPAKEKKDHNKPEKGRPLLIEINKGPTESKKGQAFEYVLIDRQRNIDWQIAYNSHSNNLYSHVKSLKKNSYKNIKYYINDQDSFICQLKEHNVPFNVIKYLKQKETIEDGQEKDIEDNKPKLKLFMDTPRIEHTRKCTSIKFIVIKDILNSNPIVNRALRQRLTRKHNVDRYSRNFLLINPVPSTSGSSSHRKLTLTTNNELNTSKKIIITCLEFPEVETVIDNVASDVAARVIDEFKNISFDIKNGKLVATMNSLVQSTFTDEFQILAKIVHLTQSKIRNDALYHDLKIHLNIKCVSMMNIVQLTIPEETVAEDIKIPEETVAEDTTAEIETNTPDTQNKYNIFTRCTRFEKELYKQSFNSYIRKIKKDQLRETENTVMPVISHVFSLKNTEPIKTVSPSSIDENTKNYFVDSNSSFASSSNTNNDAISEISQPIPVYPNFVQMNPENSQILHLSSKTIVENTIESILNRNHRPVPKSDVDVDKLERLIPVNFIIDKKIVNDLMISFSNNTVTDMRKGDNVLLKMLLERKTDTFGEISSENNDKQE